MGFLSSADVVERSASDLVGKYVGHTGPQTKAVFEKALGKVLFIDEAYRLSEGHFAKEAMDEIVGLMTQERFMHKLIIILAGYEHQMNELLSVNPGLSSRFAEEIAFQNMTPEQCLTLLDKDLRKSRIVVAELTDPNSTEYAEMKSIIESMSRLSSWGNARDVKMIAKRMVQHAFLNVSNNVGQPPSLTAGEAVEILKSTEREKQGRLSMSAPRSHQNSLQPPMASFNDPTPPPPSTSTSSETQASKPPPPQAPDTQASRRKARSKPQAPPPASASDESNRASTPELESEACRDRGVSDEVWNQLQLDKAAEIAKKKHGIEEERRLRQELTLATSEQQRAELTARALENEKRRASGDPARLAELEKQISEAKKREAVVKAAREKAVVELKRKQEEEAKRLKELEEARKKLAQMGLCPAGFQWIPQASGWRCAGGSHYRSNEGLM